MPTAHDTFAIPVIAVIGPRMQAQGDCLVR